MKTITRIFTLFSICFGSAIAEPVTQIEFEVNTPEAFSVSDLGQVLIADRQPIGTLTTFELGEAKPTLSQLGQDLIAVFPVGDGQVLSVDEQGFARISEPDGKILLARATLPLGVDPIKALKLGSATYWILDAGGGAFRMQLINGAWDLKLFPLAHTGVKHVVSLSDNGFALLTGDDRLLFVTLGSMGIDKSVDIELPEAVERIIGVSPSSPQIVYVRSSSGRLLEVLEDGEVSALRDLPSNITTHVTGIGLVENRSRESGLSVSEVSTTGSPHYILFSDATELNSNMISKVSSNGRFLALAEDGRIVLYDTWANADALRQIARERAEALLERLTSIVDQVGDDHSFGEICDNFHDHPNFQLWVLALSDRLDAQPRLIDRVFRRAISEECIELNFRQPSPDDMDRVSELRVGDFRTFDNFALLSDLAIKPWARHSAGSADVRSSLLLSILQNQIDVPNINDATIERLATQLITIFGHNSIEGISNTILQKSLYPPTNRIDAFKASRFFELDNNAVILNSRPPSLRLGLTRQGPRSAGRVGTGGSGSVVVTPQNSVGLNLATPNVNTSQATPNVNTRLQRVGDVLPRNELYVRRNNQFGTRTPRISEALERGVLVGQEVITFDDFLGLNLTGVPALDANDVLKISAGVSPIPEKLRRDPKATHYVEIVLQTADAPPTGAAQIGSDANYVFVVDRSSSMSGMKLDSVKQTIASIFSQVQDQDALGIIGFNDGVETVLKATKKNEFAPDQLQSVLNGIIATGGTDINLGIGYGFEELARFDSLNRANHLVLLSDGQPTSGETDWFVIRRQLAEGLRDTRAQVTAFAIGPAANFDELDSLVGASGGRAEAIVGLTDIGTVFEQEIQRQKSVAALDVQLKMTLSQDVSLRYFYGHEPITDPARKQDIFAESEAEKARAAEALGVEISEALIDDEEGVRVFVPNLGYGETYVVLLEVTLQDPTDADALILDMEGQYVDVPNSRAVTIGPRPVKVGTDEVDPLTTAVRAFKLSSSEIVFAALSDLRIGQRKVAIDKLNAHSDRLRTAADDLGVASLRDDRVTLRKFARLLANEDKPYSNVDSNPVGRKRGFKVGNAPSKVMSTFAIGYSNFQRVTFFAPVQ